MVSQFDGCDASHCSRCAEGALFRWPGADAPQPARPDRIVSDQPHIAESAAVVGRGTIQLEQDLEVNTQINRVRDEVDEFYTEVLQVVNVGWDVRENIMLFSEVIGFFPNSARITRPKYVYHGGMQYYPNDDVTIYLHASAGLNEAADNFFAGIGVAFRTGN